MYTEKKEKGSQKNNALINFEYKIQDAYAFSIFNNINDNSQFTEDTIIQMYNNIFQLTLNNNNKKKKL